MAKRDEIGREVVSREAWGRAKRLGYGQIWDGRRYMGRPNPVSGRTEDYREVVVDQPLIDRQRR